MIPPFLWTTWRYSNAPEGQRPFEKIFGLSKYGFCGSVVMGLYDCALFTRPQTFWTSVNCISYWVVPVTAMCATFASVAYTSAKLREKDDYFNYAVASIASSGVFYRWQNNGRLTFYFLFFILGCAKIKKYCDLHGTEPFPMKDHFAISSRKTFTKFPDMTLTKDLRGPRPWESL